MPDNHETKTCPICLDTVVQRVSCAHAGCVFTVTSCPRCDRAQVVAAFIADHEKDCIHGSVVQLPVRSTFAAPRRAA